MSSQAGQVRTVRNRQYRRNENGVTWTRVLKTDGTWTEWEVKESESAPQPAASPVYLSVVQELQAEGEPLHWYLFVAPENSRGTVYQVKGDATFMYYAHASDVDVLESPSFHNIYHLCQVDDASLALVRQYVDSTPPPQAPDRASVTKNCQHWVIDVLRALQSANVVPQEQVDQIETMVQPV